jgi:hypothetical protein
MTRRLIRVADQHPKWWMSAGWVLIIVALAALWTVADASPALGAVLVCVAALAAAIAQERARMLPRRRAERAAKTRQIERELDL